MVVEGEEIPDTDVKIFQVWYHMRRLDMASALRHFVERHKEREITCFSVDYSPKRTAHVRYAELAEYAVLVIVTKHRPLKNNGNM